MQKQTMLFGGMLFVLFLFLNGIGHAATITTTDCSQTQIQAAINSANTNDTVLIPSGNSTWTTGITIPDSKKITIKGAGYDNTVITNGYIVMGTSGSRITGIGFILPATTFINVQGIGWRIDHCKFYYVGGTGILVRSIHANGYNTALSLTGLIDNNIFINTSIAVNGQGTFETQSGIWAEASVLGTQSAVYVEDNIFSRTDGENYNCMDGNRGARTVFRYNTLLNTGHEVHSLQNDGTRSYRSWEIYGNTFTANIYAFRPMFIRGGTGIVFDNTVSGAKWSFKSITTDNNRTYNSVGVSGRCNGSSTWDGNLTIDNIPLYGDIGTGTHTGGNSEAVLTDSTKNWTADSMVYSSSVRPGATIYNITDGSSCVITANTATQVMCTLTSGTNNIWNSGDQYRITDGYPCRDQTGRGTDANLFDKLSLPYPPQNSSPVYLWANWITENSTILPFTVSNGFNYQFKSDRDYYQYVSNFNGSSGTGCGTLVARPATCTVGTAYWATNQSCSDLTGMVGPNPATPISGTLYKCTATNTWTAYYTPYTYPHPLRGGISIKGNATVINMIGGLNIVNMVGGLNVINQ